MDERSQKAFDFAQESTKQMITLSTGIIAVSITFKDFVGTVNGTARTVVFMSWVLFLASVLFGLLVLMALTGTLEPNNDGKKPASIRGKNVTIPAIAQSVTFFAGLLFAVIFGIAAL